MSFIEPSKPMSKKTYSDATLSDKLVMKNKKENKKKVVSRSSNVSALRTACGTLRASIDQQFSTTTDRQ